MTSERKKHGKENMQNPFPSLFQINDLSRNGLNDVYLLNQSSKIACEFYRSLI